MCKPSPIDIRDIRCCADVELSDEAVASLAALLVDAAMNQTKSEENDDYETDG